MRGGNGGVERFKRLPLIASEAFCGLSPAFGARLLQRSFVIACTLGGLSFEFGDLVLESDGLCVLSGRFIDWRLCAVPRRGERLARAIGFDERAHGVTPGSAAVSSRNAVIVAAPAPAPLRLIRISASRLATVGEYCWKS